MYSVKLALNRPKNILTSREEEILIKLMFGKNNTEIAHELIISVHTAKAHVCSILQKMGVSRRACVILKAIYEGWIDVSKLEQLKNDF